MLLFRLLAFCGSIICYVAAVYMLFVWLKMKHMKKVNNKLSEYIKEKEFLCIKGGNRSPYVLQEYITIIELQDCNYIVKNYICF